LTKKRLLLTKIAENSHHDVWSFCVFCSTKRHKKEMLGYMTIANERGAHFVHPFYTKSLLHFYTKSLFHFLRFSRFAIIGCAGADYGKGLNNKHKKETRFEDFD